MTTLAIIGGGIVGRSLLFSLAKDKLPFDEVLFFESEVFASPCSLNSTAIVAPRGVTAGHSPLGDFILRGLATFKQHVMSDGPAGIFPIPQFTGATSKIDQFKTRYPQSAFTAQLDQIKLTSSMLFTQEDAFMIDPQMYLAWLYQMAAPKLPLTRHEEFVTEVIPGERVTLRTQNKKEYVVDHAIFATGAGSRFWKNLFPQSKLKSSAPVHGAYLEFNNVQWELPAFSLSLDGDNLIYHAHSKKVLVGSTTESHGHVLANESKLTCILDRLQAALELDLPKVEAANIKVGIREKAQKREPYMFTENNISFIGGLYKNGYSLSLEMTKNLSDQLRGPV